MFCLIPDDVFRSIRNLAARPKVGELSAKPPRALKKTKQHLWENDDPHSAGCERISHISGDKSVWSTDECEEEEEEEG